MSRSGGVALAYLDAVSRCARTHSVALSSVSGALELGSWAKQRAWTRGGAEYDGRVLSNEGRWEIMRCAARVPDYTASRIVIGD